MSLYKYNEIRETDSLVNKIIQQGQRLRNALIQSILKNDPFSVDVLTSQTNSERTGRSEVVDKVNQEKLEEYLSGKSVSREEEQELLDLIQTMSATDLCKITERSYEKFVPCDCSICTTYIKEDLRSDLRRTVNTNRTPRSDSSDITKTIQETYRSQAEIYLKYVDSIQIGVHNLTLNDMGNRKVLASEIDTKIKLPPSINHTYFVEYHVPDCICNKSQTKTLIGVDNNYVRLCSKKLHHDAVYFKTLSVHDVLNLDKISLRDIDITFKISCRTLKQKETNVLGVAKFNLGAVELSKYVSCSQRLPITLSEDSPVVIGHLRVFVKLGCGRLYFGKEFVDAICVGKENNVAPIEQFTASSSSTFDEKIQSKKASPEKRSPKQVQLPKATKKDKATLTSDRDSKNLISTQLKNKTKVSATDITEADKRVLFGFMYVAEAEYLERTIDSYFTCRPFCLEETFCSRLISQCENPVFDFSQRIPLLYEDDLLKRFQDNYMVIEFWEKNEETDFVFGLAKVTLHQLYVAYKNPVIVKYLLKNKLPVINTDWWEPIIGLEENKIIGRVHLLLALGSEEQIKNLETERGFKQEIVRVKPKPIAIEEQVKSLETERGFKHEIVRVKPKPLPVRSQQKVAKKNTVKIDVAVQSDFKMENKNSPSAQEKMELFLSQLLTQKQKNVLVDNATNTDSIPETMQNKDDAADATNLELRKTSDLLDSLEETLALNVPPPTPNPLHNDDWFKAHIIVENALHLPVRKKCKSKKSKGKVLKKQENCLPSTYVTFETTPGGNLKITPIAYKTTNPTWNFRCDVTLPRDMLTNSQKRLIFKVWRKSNNNLTEPCLDTDVVLGFAALDLTVLSAGLPSVQGWFNIVDFSSKCNGQIKITVTPLVSIARSTDVSSFTLQSTTVQQKDEPRKLDESTELLSRALKRKFIELDEITQRLRLRLSDVTRDESDASNDELADQFERDINTLCVEDDYDMINLETETDDFNVRPNVGIGLLQLQGKTAFAAENQEPIASTSNENHVSLSEQLSVTTGNSLSSIDKQLIQGKQHIDSLLEKLTLITAPEAEAARYVSGCSITQETDKATDILKELGIESRTNINAESLFNPQMFQQIYAGMEGQTSSAGTSSSSSSSLLTNFSECRRAPDGEGTTVEDKTKAVP